MIVTKTVRHTIRVGQFESLTVEASATVDTELDVDETATDEQVLDYLDDVLQRAVQPELEAARDLDTTDSGSYVHSYPLR